MKLSLDTDRRFILYKLVGTHKCRVLFFIAVELDGTAVVAHFGKREANHFLLFLRDGASLLLHLVVDFRAEARHYFVSGTAQVSRPLSRNGCLRSAQSRSLIGCILLGSWGSWLGMSVLFLSM